jgi:hypothetical protein
VKIAFKVSKTKLLSNACIFCVNKTAKMFCRGYDAILNKYLQETTGMIIMIIRHEKTVA